MKIQKRLAIRRIMSMFEDEGLMDDMELFQNDMTTKHKFMKTLTYNEMEFIKNNRDLIYDFLKILPKTK